MKRLLALVFIGFSTSAFGQTDNSIQVVKKQQKYYLTKTCYYILKWEEIRLTDKEVEKKINSSLKDAVGSFKIDSTETDLVVEWCAGRMEYDVECKSVYSKNGLISYVFTLYTYVKGAPHGLRELETKNFDAKTGDVINFWSVFDITQKMAINDFLYHRLKARLQTTDDFIRESWEKQFQANLLFEIRDSGITINYIGDSYATSVVDIQLPYEEIKPFVKIQGYLKPFYNK